MHLFNIFKRKFHYKKLDSTSSFLSRNYKKYCNLTFVSADFQTDGHGRINRKWESEESKNLMFSFLIKDKTILEKYDSLSLSTAVAVFNSLKLFNLNNLSIKWPNDVYANNKKICGILLEGCSNGSQLESIVVGVGVNLNQEEFDNDNATSYYIETKNIMNIVLFKRTLYKEIKKSIIKLKNNNNDYLNVIRENNYLLNKEVYAEYNNEIVIAKALDINDDNTIKLLINGEIKDIRSGEISFHKE